MPALWRFGRTVVIPKPINPRGAGFAVTSLRMLPTFVPLVTTFSPS